MEDPFIALLKLVGVVVLSLLAIGGLALRVKVKSSRAGRDHVAGDVKPVNVTVNHASTPQHRSWVLPFLVGAVATAALTLAGGVYLFRVGSTTSEQGAPQPSSSPKASAEGAGTSYGYPRSLLLRVLRDYESDWHDPTCGNVPSIEGMDVHWRCPATDSEVSLNCVLYTSEQSLRAASVTDKTKLTGTWTHIDGRTGFFWTYSVQGRAALWWEDSDLPIACYVHSDKKDTTIGLRKRLADNGFVLTPKPGTSPTNQT